ncbi:MAG: 5-methyltetrahydropteroyltriglutamate--homocysteine S-methyltransferase, partial [Nocardioidaceae bacterium]
MTDQPTTSTTQPRPSIGATVLGYPRIGRDRELKKALEAYWGAHAAQSQSLPTHAAALERVAAMVRSNALTTMARAGLDTVPVNTFSLYDQVLDAAVITGAVPQRFRGFTCDDQVSGVDPELYFAMARGTTTVPPLEMTKWFDTNYHYLVPEIDAETPFALDATKVLAELEEARKAGLRGRPVLVGPWTFLRLAKATDEGLVPTDRLAELTEVYVELLAQLAEAGAEWVQLDEPAAVPTLTATEAESLRRTYDTLAAAASRPAILVSTYFGSPVEGLPALAATGIDAIALDLVRGPALHDVAGTHGLREKTVVLGAVDGRNVWRTDLREVQARLEDWSSAADELAVSTSCSLLHVPYDVSVETDLAPELRHYLAFAEQKVREVVALQRSLEGDWTSAVDGAFTASDEAIAVRDRIPELRNATVVERAAAVSESDRHREPRAERAAAQQARLDLPPLPTTTIGSFPQTAEVRRARAAYRAGRIDADEYTARMRQEIRSTVDLQERLGLDVLVHGEPERNDMVQYFAEQLAGYASTVNGWVQSYGSRCVRPPILYGDIARPDPMTVAWSSYAQSLTERPMKGMLTGPVTMLAWSFVRDDQPRSMTADQVALALRDEVADLERAGIAIIQVDEPALRELLPLRAEDQKDYLQWSVGAFGLATSNVAVDTQVHTHLCYSEFGEVIEAIDHLGADVTSVEAARSGMELLKDVAEHGFEGALGPGVYDIHSPRVPDTTEIGELLAKAQRSLPPERLWVNPDCGLKTRGYA